MRILFVVCLVLTLVGVSYADSIEVPKLNLPDVQGGVTYSLQTDKLETCATATILSYPTKIGSFDLRAGYVVEQTPIASICYKMGDLTQFGFKQPLLGLLDLSIGVYGGYDFAQADENAVWDYGIIATIVDVKF